MIEAFVGSRVQVRREGMSLSREQLAAQLGVPVVKLALWEGGLERIPPETLVTIAQLFGVSVGYFFTDP
jgi:transcriptional regulator with XRE-family HTH domain